VAGADPTAAWTCPHGTKYTGSEDFISGARNAHDEIAGWLQPSEQEGRSTNDIAQEIIAVAPQVEALVEEWFAVESAARLRLSEAQNRG
jgi:hypothetical protein